MRRLLLVPLLALAFACRENPSPESKVTNTAAEETVATTSSTPPPPAPAAPVPPVPAVQGPKLQPIDRAGEDPSLAAFRDELLAAVRRRDVDAVVAMADPKIRTSFGNGGGAADFRRMLQKPGIFEDLEQLLALGGSFVGEGEGRSFWAPYVYSAWPEKHDAFESLAVIGNDVPLRESKDLSSPTIATLDHDIVTIVSPAASDPRQVKTADGKTGWVDGKHLYSPIGYRAGFSKSAGKWKLNALVAGD
jgi:hypothetical protein